MFLPDNSILLIIDIQERLASHMHNYKSFLKNNQGLIQAAVLLDIPIVFTEQVPEKLGLTIEEIQNLAIDFDPITKSTFSCWPSKNFQNEIKNLNRENIIVAGMESHVCVYQTVIHLLENDFNVEFVIDAISSRTEDNKKAAFQRMTMAGANPTTTEMIITELIGGADHPRFKEILSLIK